MSKVREIANGFGNVLRHKLNLTTEEENTLFKARREVCNACPLNNGIICTKCFCVITAKVKAINTTCPEGHW